MSDSTVVVRFTRSFDLGGQDFEKGDTVAVEQTAEVEHFLSNGFLELAYVAEPDAPADPEEVAPSGTARTKSRSGS